MPQVIAYSKSGLPAHVHLPCYLQFWNIACSFDRHLKITFTRDLIDIGNHIHMRSYRHWKSRSLEIL